MKKIALLSRYFLLLVIILGFSGCEKDRMLLLTDGQWDFKNLTTNSDNADIKNIIALGKAILTDGTLEFFDDGTYEMDAPLFDVPTTGTYTLTGETQLLMAPTGELGVPASIDKLTKSELVYIESYVYGDISYSAIYTWVR